MARIRWLVELTTDRLSTDHRDIQTTIKQGRNLFKYLIILSPQTLHLLWITSQIWYFYEEIPRTFLIFLLTNFFFVISVKGFRNSDFPPTATVTATAVGRSVSKLIPTTRFLHMDDANDFYEVLNISKQATPDQIRQAYKTLVRKWHPDKHPPSSKDEAETRFKSITQAYGVGLLRPCDFSCWVWC